MPLFNGQRSERISGLRKWCHISYSLLDGELQNMTVTTLTGPSVPSGARSDQCVIVLGW
jgi:hypothetical protein